jgi:protein-arginine kinase
MDPSKISVDLSESAKAKVISTRIRVGRNLAAYPLNPGGTKDTRCDIAKFMEGVYSTFEGDFEGTFYRHTTMTAEET